VSNSCPLCITFLNDFSIIFQNGRQKGDGYIDAKIPSLVEHFEDKFPSVAPPPPIQGQTIDLCRYIILCSTFLSTFFSLNTGTTVVGRNPATSDIFLDSAIHKALISRLHARITTHPESHKVTICDTSLNGTFVNDKKILDTEELRLGDVVTFGHLKGSVLEPGTVAKQHHSEFQFKVYLLNKHVFTILQMHRKCQNLTRIQLSLK